MSENKDKFQGDFRREVKKEEALNDFTSDLNEGKIIETSDETLESIRKTFNEEIDPLAKASETSITINSNPFDKTLEIMSQTLVSIDAKMDVENSQLQKLDQLSKIKNQLNRLENINIATEKLTLENEEA